MKEGLLWFDNDPKRALADKVKRAASCYQTKFHRKPTVCYVNLVDLNEPLESVGSVDLRPAKNVLRHHLWIGEEDPLRNAEAA